MLINNIVFNYTRASLTGFVVLVYLCLNPPDDELVETAIRMRHIRDKWLCIIGCAVFLLPTVYCIRWSVRVISSRQVLVYYLKLCHNVLVPYQLHSLLIVIQSSDAMLIWVTDRLLQTNMVIVTIIWQQRR